MKKTDKRKIEEFIRVDHAGERGAIKIYEGQLLALNTIKKDERPETLKLLIKSIESSLKFIVLIIDKELFIKKITGTINPNKIGNRHIR